ncbi:hydrolase [Maribacter sp. ACAM166]|nr:hydrolase [Maribacter sp. ACAM166]
MNEVKIIAVDFDGTIVEHSYPKIGKQMFFAFATLKKLQQKGHRLILWTYREGIFLEEAVAYCLKNGVHFYAINENYLGEKSGKTYSRKLNADIFIDDRNVGGFLGWEQIWHILHPEDGEFSHQFKNEQAHLNFPLTIKNWLGFFGKKS